MPEPYTRPLVVAPEATARDDVKVVFRLARSREGILSALPTIQATGAGGAGLNHAMGTLDECDAHLTQCVRSI